MALLLLAAILLPVPAFSQKTGEKGARHRGMDEIKADLNDARREKRMAALQEIKTSTSPLKIEALKSGMESEDPVVRGESVRALGETGDKAVLPALFEALASSDTRIRLGAIEALALLKDPSAVEPLAALLKDENRNIRWAAVRALGAIGDKAAVEPLLDAAGTDASVHVRRGAIEALGKIGDKAAVRPLRRFLEDEDEGVRGWASYTLKTLGYEK